VLVCDDGGFGDLFAMVSPLEDHGHNVARIHR
jgi:hypothetical protein